MFLHWLSLFGMFLILMYMVYTGKVMIEEAEGDPLLIIIGGLLIAALCYCLLYHMNLHFKLIISGGFN